MFNIGKNPVSFRAKNEGKEPTLTAKTEGAPAVAPLSEEFTSHPPINTRGLSSQGSMTNIIVFFSCFFFGWLYDTLVAIFSRDREHADQPLLWEFLLWLSPSCSALKPYFEFFRKWFGAHINRYQKQIRLCIFFVNDIVRVSTRGAFFSRVFSFVDSLMPEYGPGFRERLLKEFGNVELETQSGSWITQARQTIANWKLAKDSIFGKSLHKLAGFFAFGLITANLPSSSVSDRFADFYASSGLSSLNAVDFTTTFFESFFILLERIQDAYTSGHIMDLFGTIEGSLNRIELEQARLIGLVLPFCLGRLSEESPPLSNQVYIKQFEDHVQLIRDKLTATTGTLNVRLGVLLGQATNKLADVRAYNLASSGRVPAYAIALWGPSGTGKSGLTNAISSTLMRHHGYVMEDGTTDPQLIGTQNSAEKFQSGLHAYDVVQCVDDMGNTKAEKCQVDPSAILLDLVNNASKTMNKADTLEKGRVPFQAPFVIVTTNDRTLGAGAFSVDPTSRLRRIQVYVQVEVKPEFRKPGTEQLDSTKLPPGDPDVWLITCTSFKPNPGPLDLGGQGVFPVFSHTFADGTTKEMHRVDIATFLAFLCDHSMAYSKREKSITVSNTRLHNRPSCPHGMLGGSYCLQCRETAPFSPLEQQGLREWLAAPTMHLPGLPDAHNVVTDINQYLSEMEARNTAAAHECVRILRSAIASARESTAFTFEGVPFPASLHAWTENKFLEFRDCTWVLSHPLLTGFLVLLACQITFFLPCWSLAQYIGLTPRVSYLISTLLGGILGVTIVRSLWMYWRQRVLHFSRDRIRAALSKEWSHIMKRLSIVVLCVTIAYALYRAYCWFVKAVPDLTPQGEEVRVPDLPAVPVKAPWAVHEVVRVPVIGKANTMTPLQALDRLRGATAWAEFTGPVQANNMRIRDRMSVLCVRNGLYLVPNHAAEAVHGFPIKVRLFFAADGTPGTQYETTISEKQWCPIAGLDLAMVELAVGRNVRDNLDLLPTLRGPNAISCYTVRRQGGGALVEGRLRATPGPIDFGALKGTALEYSASETTGPGMCGMVLIAERSPPFIAGLHVAGETGTTRGVAAMPLRAEVETAINVLIARGCCAIRPAVECVDLSCGGRVQLLDHIPPKSPMRWLDADSQLSYYGAHDQGSRTFRSNIVDTKIAPSVCEVFGVEPIFGAPRNLNNPRAWQHNLEACCHPAALEPEFLDMAQRDLTCHWELAAAADPSFAHSIHEVDYSTAINGVNGIKEMGPINMKTSRGWPDNKSKTTLFEKSGIPTPSVLDPWVAPPEFIEECESTIAKLATGVEVPFIFRASLKDEAVKKTKEWPRLFCGAPVMLVVLVRKYFLTLCAWIMAHQLWTENMCGIDAYSPEWNDLAQFLSFFGTGLFVAGDYAMFDKKIAVTLMEFAFGLLIHMCSIAGYSARQQTVMRGLASAICRAYLEINGEYVRLLGSNPSGHPLTVVINGIVNSVYIRYVWYYLQSLMPPEDRVKFPKTDRVRAFNEAKRVAGFAEDERVSIPPDFKPEAWMFEDVFDTPSPHTFLAGATTPTIMEGVEGLFSHHVSLVTYGDDNVLQPSARSLFLTHTAIADVLAKGGISYTMADKTSESVPFIPLERVTFLKRYFRFDDDKGIFVAPLERLSCFKPLLCRDLTSMLTHNEHCGVSLSNLLRESYFRGQAQFESDRASAQFLVDEFGLSTFLNNERLSTYEEMDNWWRDKYTVDHSVNTANLELQGDAAMAEESDQEPDSWPAELTRGAFLLQGSRQSVAAQKNGAHLFQVRFSGPLDGTHLPYLKGIPNIRGFFASFDSDLDIEHIALRMSSNTQPGTIRRYLIDNAPRGVEVCDIWMESRKGANGWTDLVMTCLATDRWQSGLELKDGGAVLSWERIA